MLMVGDMASQHEENPGDDIESMLDLLDRLESLREDMDDLGISSLDELNARIQELHHRIDQTEEETPEK
jgi:hypothetical protein